MRSLDEGIEEVRKMLPRCYFDMENCKNLIKHLEEYQEDFNETTGKYTGKPAKNGAQHAADAFRYMAVNLQFTKNASSAEDVRNHYNMAKYGNRDNDYAQGWRSL